MKSRSQKDFPDTVPSVSTAFEPTAIFTTFPFFFSGYFFPWITSISDCTSEVASFILSTFLLGLLNVTLEGSLARCRSAAFFSFTASKYRLLSARDIGAIDFANINKNSKTNEETKIGQIETYYPMFNINGPVDVWRHLTKTRAYQHTSWEF